MTEFDMALSFIPQVQKALEFAGGKFVAAPAGINGERWFFQQLIPMAGDAEPVYEVKTTEAEGSHGGIPVRIYRPSAETNLPVLVYFHGGSFYMGDLETHDRVTRALANASGALVVAVDYRRSPEHPFPAPLDDAWSALLWVYRNAGLLGADSTRIAVAGDSAGGNLATVVARRARDAGAPKLALQVLTYPAIDPSLGTESWQTYAEGPILTAESIRNCWTLYVPNADDLNNPDIAPAQAASLAGVAPALIITAEHDPLRDEGEAYARKLESDGVQARVHRYPDMVHGFFQMGGFVDAGKDAIQEVADALKTAFKII
jgi:acetyl esterase